MRHQPRSSYPPVVSREDHLSALSVVLGDLGPRACATGISAAVLLGWEVVDLPARPRVAVPRAHSHLLHPDADLVRLELLPAERERAGLRSLPLVLPPRLLRELARDLPLAEAVAVVDSAVHGDLPMLEEWRAVTQGWAGPWAGRLARVLALADHRAGSPLESLGRVALTLGGVVPLVPQHRLLLPDGHPYDLLVADGSRVLIELDGDTHRERGRFATDLDDGIFGLDEGYLVLRAGWRHVRHQRDAWVAHVQRQVARQHAQLRTGHR